MLLFAQDPAVSQAIGVTALISTIVTGLLAMIGTQLANRQAARNKADDRDNDDKWRMISDLREELTATKKEAEEDRRRQQERYDELTRDHVACLQNHARVEERVGFLEETMMEQGIRVPRKRPDRGSDTHVPLPHPEPDRGKS
jgi:uncharacterized protein YlxW (UPF0749 family)